MVSLDPPLLVRHNPHPTCLCPSRYVGTLVLTTFPVSLGSNVVFAESVFSFLGSVSSSDSVGSNVS